MRRNVFAVVPFRTKSALSYGLSFGLAGHATEPSFLLSPAILPGPALNLETSFSHGRVCSVGTSVDEI